ncbi:MAG: hypothetical protein ACT4N5_07850 [Nitrosopumilaceae archaeon]
MVHIRIGGRGTTRRVAEKEEEQNWSGDAFKEYSKQRKEAAKDNFITVGRGTTKIKFGDIPSTQGTSTKGMWISSGRGTGKRQL